MPAPRTDPERQLRLHRTPIVAMLLIPLVVLGGFLWWFTDESDDPRVSGTTPLEEMAQPPGACRAGPRAMKRAGPRDWPGPVMASTGQPCGFSLPWLCRYIMKPS